MRESLFVPNALSVAVPTPRHDRRPQLIASLDGPMRLLYADDGRIIRIFREVVERWEEAPQAGADIPASHDAQPGPGPATDRLRQSQAPPRVEV